MVKIEVVKICAVGCDKSFATFRVGNKDFTCFINRGMYYRLKDMGVVTS